MRPALAPAQSDQRLCYSLSGKYNSYTRYMQDFKVVSVAEQAELSLLGRKPDRFPHYLKAPYLSDRG